MHVPNITQNKEIKPIHNPNWSFNEYILNNTVVKIYPNPASSKIHLESLGKSSQTYYIYDYSGKSLKTSRFINYTEIDISEYPKGIYVLSIVDDKKIIENKTIVKY